MTSTGFVAIAFPLWASVRSELAWFKITQVVAWELKRKPRWLAGEIFHPPNRLNADHHSLVEGNPT
jgi:hypothetical protein